MKIAIVSKHDFLFEIIEYLKREDLSLVSYRDYAFDIDQYDLIVTDKDSAVGSLSKAGDSELQSSVRADARVVSDSGVGARHHNSDYEEGKILRLEYPIVASDLLKLIEAKLASKADLYDYKGLRLNIKQRILYAKNRTSNIKGQGAAELTETETKILAAIIKNDGRFSRDDLEKLLNINMLDTMTLHSHLHRINKKLKHAHLDYKLIIQAEFIKLVDQ